MIITCATDPALGKFVATITTKFTCTEVPDAATMVVEMTITTTLLLLLS